MSRMQRDFKTKHTHFMGETFKMEFSSVISSSVRSSRSLPAILPMSTESFVCRGRPRLDYNDYSCWTKRRRVQELKCQYDQEALTKAVLPKNNEHQVMPIVNDENNFLNAVLAMNMDMEMPKAK